MNAFIFLPSNFLRLSVSNNAASQIHTSVCIYLFHFLFPGQLNCFKPEANCLRPIQDVSIKLKADESVNHFLQPSSSNRAAQSSSSIRRFNRAVIDCDYIFITINSDSFQISLWSLYLIEITCK